jgi:A/G-specific adenine glycosylase
MEGLGYYSRARTMQKAARLLVEKFDAKLPEEASILEKLPGIGPYTAAAISSIAFGKDEAVVDGNVKRVLARVCNYAKPVNIPASQLELRRMAQDLLPQGKAGDYNQAVMDLGATICTPRAPKCAFCPCRRFAQRQRLICNLPCR